MSRAPRRLFSILPLVCFLAAASTRVQAWEESNDPVESARQSLAGDRFPWYDPGEDGVRNIRVRIDPGDAANRDSDWTARKRAPKSNSPRQWSRSPGAGFWEFMQVVFWIVVGVLLALLVLAGVWAFVKSEGRITEHASQTLGVTSSNDDAARVENLPFQVRQPKADLLAEARRNYEAGNYGEAIIYLFSYQLVELDKSHLIQLAKGKTNRQYLRETRPQPGIRTILEGTMLAFEDVFFGHHILEKDDFEHCWHQLDQFHQGLQQAAT